MNMGYAHTALQTEVAAAGYSRSGVYHVSGKLCQVTTLALYHLPGSSSSNAHSPSMRAYSTARMHACCFPAEVLGDLLESSVRSTRAGLGSHDSRNSWSVHQNLMVKSLASVAQLLTSACPLAH